MRLREFVGAILTMVVPVLAIGCSGEPASTVAAAGISGTSAASPASGQRGLASTGNPQSGPVVLGTRNGVDLAADYLRRCQNQTKRSLECVALRNVLVVETAKSLREVEVFEDQRGVAVALSALDLLEEPQVLIAAARVLGHFPETPNLAPRMVRLMLESPYVAVQRMAANVLIANPNQEFQDLGRMWLDNHHEAGVGRSVFAEYPDFPAHYASVGFPKYAGAEWFSAGDSDRSIGWSTKDDVAAVAKWYGDTLHAELLGVDKWNEVYQQQTLILMKFDQTKMARMQQLMERVVKGEQAAMAELEKLQKQVDADQKLAEEAFEKSIIKAAMISGTFARDAKWIIAAKKGERISRLVVVFPIPAIQRTVVKEIWDLSDYPSAWPKVASR